MKITLPTIRFLIIAGLSLFSFTSHAQTNVVPDDVEFHVLKNFYDSLGGSAWTNKTNWPVAGSWPSTATAAQFGTWLGVQVVNGDIVSIGLAQNNLVGILPRTIGNLTQLKTLSLYSNKITGGIPSSLSKCINLQSLGLFLNTTLGGTIPTSLGQVTSLTNIALSSTGLTGTIPAELNSLTNLTYLDVSANSLTGDIPYLGSLTKLQTLLITSNATLNAGPIPSWIANFPNLTTLKLSKSNRTGSIPSFLGSLSNLQLMYLDLNQLTGAIPVELGTLTKMADLELQSNQLTGSIPSSLGSLANLNYLYLYSNQLSGAIPAELGNLSKLISLNLQSNQLTGAIPATLGKLTNMTSISLSANQLSGSIPTSLGSLTKLTGLYLFSNQLTGPIPDTFGNLTNLTGLYLYNNLLSGSLPSSLGNLNKLVYFHIYNNQFTGSLPPSLSGLSQLVYFYIYSNKFTGSFPAFNWPKINLIQIQYNYFTGVFPDVSNMPQLYYLSAANNLFTGIDPSILSKSQMTYIHFINNELTSIPDFSQHLNKANLAVYFQSNRLDFSKLEPLLTAGLKTVGTPLTQKNIHDFTYVTPALGTQLVIQARPKGSNAFTWEKQVNGTWTDVTAQNQDASTNVHTYTRNSFALADEGTYRWKETSAIISGVTIQSDPIQVKVPVRVALDNWTFQYKYDGRDRMIGRKAPNADWVYMVYDDRDRVVLTQDGNQRSLNQWAFTKYDALNRPVMTGIYTHTAAVDQPTMQGVVDTFYTPTTQVWYDSYVGNGTGIANVNGYDNKSFPQIANAGLCTTVTYYDNYNFKSLFGTGYNYVPGDSQPATEFAYVTGLVTGTKTKVLTGASVTGSTWLNSVTYYDSKYRVIQSVADNLQTGRDRVSNLVDFTGRVLESKTTHNTSSLQWKDLVNVTVNNNNNLATTITAQSWGNSGAASVQNLPAGTDGWLEVTASEATYRMIGFSAANIDANYTSIDYAMYLNGSSFSVYEKGTSKNGNIPLVTGDVLRIERIGTAINYYRNSTLFYTSKTPSTTSLLADVAFYTPGSTITNIRASFALATPDVSVTKRFEYDHMGRLMKTWHQVGTNPEVLLAKNEYNELGQLVDKKEYSTEPASTSDDQRNFKQSVDYRYNIRGWLTSINNSQLTADGLTNDDNNDLFGMNLSYNDVVTGINNTPQYNGNISAIKWSKNLALGTVKDQAYSYSYDALNRISSSAYLTNNSTWTASSAFAENNFQYDLNGNIQKLTRTDLNGNATDILTYDYGSGNTLSNQLLSVSDAGDLAKDFVDGNLASTDYTYDPTGSMTVDNNKGITAITYNYLHLPQQVTKSTGDYIKYTYDATGRKLSQQLYNSANVIQKKTDYAGEFYYENDVLQFINHQEGRVVMTGTAPEYQYNITDHLGNVRTTFTTKVDVDSETATLEAGNLATERGQFINIDDARRINSPLFDHTYDNQTRPVEGVFSERLSGTSADGYTHEKYGLAKSLSVMPGDQIDMEVYAKYVDMSSPDLTGALNTLVSAIATNTAAPGTVVDGSGYAGGSGGTLPFTGVTDPNADPDDVAPRAYLNYLIYDRNYKPLGNGSVQITTAAKENGQTALSNNGEGVAHEKISASITITEPGYVYIYLSNDEPTTKEVYFDDFKVTHTKSPVIQTNDYYAGGATFNNYGRENSMVNKLTMQGTEHLDDLNLNLQDFGARQYDPYTWRTTTQDPHGDSHANVSPYSFLNNNPIGNTDPSGMDDWGILDEEEAAASAYAQQQAEQYAADYAMQYESEIAEEESTMSTVLGLESMNSNDDNYRLTAESGVLDEDQQIQNGPGDPRGIDYSKKISREDITSNKDYQLIDASPGADGWNYYTYKNLASGKNEYFAYLLPNEDASNIPMRETALNSIARPVFNFLGQASYFVTNLFTGFTLGFSGINSDQYRMQIWVSDFSENYFEYDPNWNNKINLNK